jgi:nicotinate-nucleotide pyrophosphorylase (carboxylating)
MFETDRIIRNALQEDIGLGDVTTLATIEAGVPARAELVAKEDFILAGIDVAARVFALLDGEGVFLKSCSKMAWP